MGAQACNGSVMTKDAPKRPRDPNELAKLITDLATGSRTETLRTPEGKDLVASLLGRRGGLKGGAARAAKLSPEERREIAKAAAAARWGKKK